MSERLISDRVPYLPIRVQFGRTDVAAVALLDTGFEGEVIVPESLIDAAGAAAEGGIFRLADGSRILRPSYDGMVTVGTLGDVPVRVVALDSEYLVGLRLASRFTITLDHGRRLIVEP